MALIGNRTVLHKSPGRFLSGTVASIERSNFGKAGMLANRFQSMSPIFAGLPSGHLPPSSWSMPRTAGAMSAINAAGLELSAGELSIAAGRNITGDSVFAFTAPNADLQLVVSATGEATLTLTGAGLLAGALSGIGSASITFTADPAGLGAIVDAVATASLALSAAATIRATGELAGDIVPYTELSPESLASAVWGALAAANNTAGTMGEKLNDAGSASNPWTEVIESGYTAAEILRIIVAVTAGKASGGPGSPVFRDIGDTKARVTGTADADGNRTAVTYDAT